MDICLEPYSDTNLSNELWSVNHFFENQELKATECNTELRSIDVPTMEKYQIYLQDTDQPKVILSPDNDVVELTMIPVDEEYAPDTPPMVSDEDPADPSYFPIVEEKRKRKSDKSTAQVRRHKCQMCDKRFVRPAELKRHETTHTNKREFTCGICDQGFKRVDHYRSHYISIHSEKRRQCQFCDYKTARKDTLQRHIACRHPNAV
jgi:hypothetical protein